MCISRTTYIRSVYDTYNNTSSLILRIKQIDMLHLIVRCVWSGSRRHWCVCSSRASVICVIFLLSPSLPSLSSLSVGREGKPIDPDRGEACSGALLQSRFRSPLIQRCSCRSWLFISCTHVVYLVYRIILCLTDSRGIILLRSSPCAVFCPCWIVPGMARI